MSGFAEDLQVVWVKMECCREDEKYAENRVFLRKFCDQLGPHMDAKRMFLTGF